MEKPQFCEEFEIRMRSCNYKNCKFSGECIIFEEMNEN